MSNRYQSWGRYPKAEQQAYRLNWRDDALPDGALGDGSFLPFGNGRSYGDVCLNDGGKLVDCRGLNRFIEFDEETGILRAEAGVLLSEIHALTVERGWFLPVTPGTQFATLGGAIANDVHGKNHHRAGTFGRHVRCFELLRSDGTRLACSPEENDGYFRATIAGLGMTGVITWAEIALQRIGSAYIDQETIRFANLDEFFSLARESDGDYEHTVAWVDCLPHGDMLGRGLFTRGNHADAGGADAPGAPSRRLRFPIDPPFTLVNRLTLKLFNDLYYRRQRAERVRSVEHYARFFYPLDSILSWNRIYGSRGFLQYQCAIPVARMEDGIREILSRIAKSGMGSFLAVLKVFGDQPSPGLLSFPMPGATLALDFPNRGSKTFKLLDELDEVTRETGGRLYPSKDARMHARDFQAAYPSWQAMADFIDPGVSSSFWRRVTGATE